MNITTEQYQKIMRFLNTEMDDAEMDAFEKELNANPEMRSQLDFEQSVRDSFALRNITVLPGIELVDNSAKINVPFRGVKQLRVWVAISAAVVSVIVFLSIFFKKTEKNTVTAATDTIDTAQQSTIPPQVMVAEPVQKDSVEVIDLVGLFKQYFKKDTLPEHYPLFLAEALIDYESGNYKALQQLNLKDLPQTRGADETGNRKSILQLGYYYKGLAFLQTGNTNEAIVNLKWVLNNQPDKNLRARAQWYLALIYLKENNGEKAAELCRSIINNKENHILVKNAEKIFDIIEK
ncbi:MAG: tetratricopeptide repeat protein [Agriterribacter sp.]